MCSGLKASGYMTKETKERSRKENHTHRGNDFKDAPFLQKVHWLTHPNFLSILSKKPQKTDQWWLPVGPLRCFPFLPNPFPILRQRQRSQSTAVTKQQLHTHYSAVTCGDVGKSVWLRDKKGSVSNSSTSDFLRSGTKVFVLLIQCSVDFNFSECVV